jgi:hypothetical protein
VGFFTGPSLFSLGTAPRLGVLPLFLVCCSVLLGLSVAAFEDWPAAIGCRDQTMWLRGWGVGGWGSKKDGYTVILYYTVVRILMISYDYDYL